MKRKRKTNLNPRIMNQVFLSGVVLFLILSSCSSLFACTSFAVYADNPFYGMNFDYDPSREMMFCIDRIGTVTVFDMRFDLGGYYGSTVAVNSNGLFCNLQELYPEVPPEDPDPDEMTLVELFVESANSLGSCQDVRTVMDNYRIVMGSISLHSLYADMTGDAMVVEVGQEGNVITPMKGNFIVMTNFPNNECADTGYEEVYGAGDDRYKAAYAYLLEHNSTFDVDDGFAVLKRAVNTSEYYPTRCSLVFDPENNDVYVALEGNFDKIWKISLENETVETFKGFDTYFVMDIGEGVTATQLKARESELDKDECRYCRWIYAVGAIVAVGIFIVLYKKGSQH